MPDIRLMGLEKCLSELLVQRVQILDEAIVEAVTFIHVSARGLLLQQTPSGIDVCPESMRNIYGKQDVDATQMGLDSALVHLSTQRPCWVYDLYKRHKAEFSDSSPVANSVLIRPLPSTTTLDYWVRHYHRFPNEASSMLSSLV